ncbi:MAG: sortase [Candidatus Gottesmanbacteria bacterium]
MAIYVYIKTLPKQPLRVQSILFSSFFLVSGIFFLSLVALPIITFQLFYTPKYASVISPLSDTQVLGTQTDFTQVTNWFPNEVKRTSPSKITSYTLSIPKLNIKSAVVNIGSSDLSKSLIQWDSAILPGEFGNAVVFGHSVLPAFFDPKNYMTIFSTLPTLKLKDEFYVYFDGITYRYQVVDLKVIDPQDISVLEQTYDGSYISLVTCVPPGTYWKRLVVKSRLVKI